MAPLLGAFLLCNGLARVSTTIYVVCGKCVKRYFVACGVTRH